MATMSSRNFLAVAGAGVILAFVVAFLLNRPHPPQPPAFQPAANPYPKAIYANGVIESEQASGSNINILPEVSGPVTEVFVREGERVRAGQSLFAIDSSVQKATAEQQRLQAEAAGAALAELKAQPRRETLDIAVSQLAQAQANLKTLVDQRDKLLRSAELDARSVSRESLDAAVDAAKAGEAAVEVAQRQLDLTRAGAWVYDIQNQQAQYAAASHAYDASAALLEKYVVKAPADGVVLALNTTRGGYVSPQGAYDTYTQANQPAAVLGPGAAGGLAVRCYIDEILLNRLPKAPNIKAEMIVRGSDLHVPLQFVRIQPYVTPKIELSDQRQERVDLRVLPVIFRFSVPTGAKLYPGQLVDVYISEQ
jgi:HlyD family secretion protein